MAKLNNMQKQFIEQETEKLIELTKQKNEFLKLSTLNASQFEALKSVLRQIETSQGKISFASQPVKNTPERVAAIDNFIKNIEVEVDMPTAKEHKQITSFDIFVSNLDNYIDKIKEHSQVLKDQLACESAILDMLEKLEPTVPEEIKDVYTQRLENSRKIKNDLIVVSDCNAQRIEDAVEMRKRILDNYELLSDVNFFMNNPLNMPDYEERVKAVASIL